MAVSIHWFRHGLRLHDNPALLASLQSAEELYPLFICDGNVAGMADAAYPRMRFLWQSIRDLDRRLRDLGSRLYVIKGQPVEVFTRLFEEWHVTRVTFEQDPEPIWIERDNAVKELCKAKGVQCLEFVSHTLWDPQQVVRANGGQPPHTFKLFNQVVQLIGAPPRPVPDGDFSSLAKIDKNQEEKFSMPSYSEFGVEPEWPEQENPHNKWNGGETEALDLFRVRMEIESKAFEEGVVLPNQYKVDLVNAPRSLSPHLRFGCLSIRKFYWSLHDAYKKIRDEEVPVNVTAQLIWREYFYCMSFNNINYCYMQNNPICLQIPWYKDADKLEKWVMGKTGFPWIDACMNQLRIEGWIHHVCRHAVACFLTRGDLWLSWEDGKEVFFKYLLDGDWSVCAGNWMWVSSSAFENCLSCPQCFSPVLYGMRMDPTGEYTRRYVPALANMPLRYLFCPWKAPQDIQKEAGCVVGEDYPAPMVDHATAWRKCKSMMEEVKSIFKDPKMWHCAPSDSAEVQKFCFLPRHDCSSDLSCQGNVAA